MDLLKKAEEKKVLLVAHRGTCGGNIPCNSMPAFQAALCAGADMIELDVSKSADGELFVLHPAMEWVHLRMRDRIFNYPSTFVEQVPLSNWDISPTQYPILKLEEALTFLRGKCLINIDKFWEHPKEISELIRKLGMEDQILIKTDNKPEYLDAVEKYAPDIPYMVMARGEADVHYEMMKRNINYVGIEAIFTTENSHLASKEFIDQVHADGKILWADAIVYDYREILSAGHTDDISMTGNPEYGWGWLADKGFNMIQTDFIYQCRDFLEKTGRRTNWR